MLGKGKKRSVKEKMRSQSSEEGSFQLNSQQGSYQGYSSERCSSGSFSGPSIGSGQDQKIKDKNEKMKEKGMLKSGHDLSSSINKNPQGKSKNKQVKVKETGGITRQANKIDPPNSIKLAPLIRFKAFLNQIGPLKHAPGINLDILEKYTLLSPLQINQSLNCHTIQSLVKQRLSQIKHVQHRRWDMNDVLCLIWILSRMFQYKKYQYSSNCSLVQNDYKILNSIFQHSEPKSEQFLQILMQNKYTDKWQTQESHILLEVYLKFSKERQSIDWTEVSDELLRRNKSLFALYRCPIQCQKQWTRLQQESRQWTYEEDDQLLALVYFGKSQEPEWRKIEQFFQNKSPVSLKTRFYGLLQKLKAACPYSNRLTKLQLLKQKIDGRIKLDNEVEKSVSRKDCQENDQNPLGDGRKFFLPKGINDSLYKGRQSQEDIHRHKKIRQLIVELQNHIQDAFHSLGQLKRLDDNFDMNNDYDLVSNQIGVLGSQDRAQTKKRGRKKILTYKKGRNSKQFGRALTKKNDRPEFSNVVNKVIYKNSDFEVIREFNSESEQAYGGFKGASYNDNDSKSSDNF